MAGSKRRKRRNNRETGSYYERMAGVYLTEKGYEILEYNYRCKLGEIDIIARDGDYLVFCEVKYRADDRKGTPPEAGRLCQTESYLKKCTLLYDGEWNR